MTNWSHADLKIKQLIRQTSLLLQAYKCTFFITAHGHEVDVPEVHADGYGGEQTSHQPVDKPVERQSWVGKPEPKCNHTICP